MLVLSRKSGQSLLIGENIEIQIVEIQGDKVRIAIDAPKSVSILRKELMEEMKEANKEAAQKISGVSLEELGNAFKKK